MERTALKKTLNANQIKLIAIVAMTIDHLTWAIFPGTQAVWYVFALHIIGRLTAPIMWFFLAEGCHYTHDMIDAGYEVAVASDGVAGIAMFDDTIDLVLLDIMLPKIDGYGVCEVIRKRSQVPIIMLTALSDEENQLRGFEQQIDDYIPKSFSPKILLCKIAAILRRRMTENQNQWSR